VKEQKVKVERRDKIAIVTICNPPVNALDEQVISEMEVVFNEIAKKQTTDLAVVIITGAGEKFFVAGADISQFPALRREDGKRLAKRGTDLYEKIAGLYCPVICAVNGVALGGGLELALACDFRVVSKNAKLGVPEVGLGIFPGYGGTQRLPRLIGSGLAKQMVFTGSPVNAEEAYRAGLCEVLTEPGCALECALTFAEKIAANAPLAVAGAKKVINQGMELSLVDAIVLENDALGDLYETSDKNEGAAAFFEKRKPLFQGK